MLGVALRPLEARCCYCRLAALSSGVLLFPFALWALMCCYVLDSFAGLVA